MKYNECSECNLLYVHAHDCSRKFPTHEVNMHTFHPEIDTLVEEIYRINGTGRENEDKFYLIASTLAWELYESIYDNLDPKDKRRVYVIAAAITDILDR